MADLDLEGLALVAGVVLPRALDELARRRRIRIPFLSVRLALSAMLRHAVQRKNPSLTSCHSPFLLAAVAHCDRQACEGRSTLGIAELGIAADVFRLERPGSSLPLFLGACWLRPKPFRRHRNKSATERRNTTHAEGERALMSAQRAVA